MSGHDDDPCIRAHTEADEFQPVLYLPLQHAHARLPNEQVNGPTTEKELVGDPIHLLSPEVPGVQLHLDTRMVGMRQMHRMDVNTHSVGRTFAFLGIASA